MGKKLFLGLYVILLLGVCYKTIAVDVDLYLNIVNSFSGTVIITGNNIINKGNIFYSPTTTPLIQITSNAASSYSISGDIAPPTSGTQSQPYTIQTTISLTKTNTVNEIFPVFQKGGEPLIHKKLSIFVDTFAPSTPTIISPTNNTNRNGATVIQWNIATDFGAGLQQYMVLISTDQTFATTVYYQTTPNNEQYLDTTTLPTGKLYLKILAKDDVANISESQTIMVCNKCTEAQPSGGGGGGGGSYTPPSPPTDIQWITIIENIEEKQKAELKEEPTIGFISNILYSEELLSAYKYAYTLGITTMPTAYQADLKGSLIRKDLAKMISEYAIKIAKIKPDNRLLCNFDDLGEETLETKYYTKLACKLGLMGRHADGKTKQDKFNPYEKVNRAQFGTVLSRTLYGEKNNIQTGEKYDRYEKHLFALRSKDIMQKIDTPRSQELRGRVMVTMMRADPNRKIQHASPK